MKKRRNRRKKIILLLFIIVLCLGVGSYFVLMPDQVSLDFSFMSESVKDVAKKIEETKKEEEKETLTPPQEETITSDDNGYGKEITGPTYIKGILIVNKTYSLPNHFATGNDETAYTALQRLQAGANQDGYSMPLLSGFRSQQTQETLYNRYVARDGKDLADTYSARPGHSEHETGLAFDIGSIDNNYGETNAGRWLKEHAHEYGFIIRYPKGKEDITGYQYEPWHVRYLGVEHAKKIYEKNITLEEYLGIA